MCVCVYIYQSRKRHVLIHPYSMRYALSGESPELFRGVRGYAPPENFEKMLQFGAF